MRRWGARLGLLLTLACGGPREPDQFGLEAVLVSADSATRSFAAAERALDPERAVSHLAPEFYLYNDGARVGYDSVVARIRRSFPGLRRFETSWRDIEVTALGPDHALVSFRFDDRLTDTSGAVTLLHGPTTLIWRRRGVDWLIIFADADHYPGPAL